MSFLTSLSPKNRWLVVSVITVLIGGFLVLILSYSQYLSTKVVGKKSIPVITVAGPRVPVVVGNKYTVMLPTATTALKIELCYLEKKKTRCRILVSSVKGTPVMVTIPHQAVPGSGVIKVTERSGAKLGRVLLQRAVLIKKATPTATPSSTGGGSSGGNGGNSGGDATPSSSVLPVGAQFLTPTETEVVSVATPLDVRVELTETTTSRLRCQEWLLNGVSIPVTEWTNGQAPDLSAEPCV